jgi:isocitrate lyase
MGVPTLIIARSDAKDSPMITTDIDPRDRPFLTGGRTSEGFFRTRGGLDVAIARSLAYAPFADIIWFETNEPNLEEARKFADAIHAKFPDKLLYYNCSSSFNWKKMLDDAAIARFQPELGTMGYKIQNCTGVGLNSMYLSLFKTVRRYRETGMPALASVQQDQREAVKDGYKGWKTQEFVGAGYFDDVAQTIAGAALSTGAVSGSTEESQF